MTYENLDVDYLNRIMLYFQKNRDKKKYLSELTATPKKYIEHVKYYIDIRNSEYPDVTFSDDYTILYIH